MTVRLIGYRVISAAALLLWVLVMWTGVGFFQAHPMTGQVLMGLCLFCSALVVSLFLIWDGLTVKEDTED